MTDGPTTDRPEPTHKSAGAGGPSRLPAELTSFVGRGAELSQIRQLLQSRRLVTLLGPGGVGKTRLALRAAARCHGLFPGGARVVELASAGQTEPLSAVLAGALGLGQSSRPPLELVVDHLRGKPTVLVLDNCEHLVAELGPLVEDLLRAAPTLRVLATSRQPLGVQSEQLFTVAPLQLPDETVSLEAAPAYSAMTLFADRACSAVQGFTVTADNVVEVAELCRRLEGIPLAIELAAVRLKVLSLTELSERLQDRFALLSDVRPGRPVRHQTLRTTLDWTAELCSPSERCLWAYSSLFAGGFTVDAIESLCAAADAAGPDEVLTALTGLADKSVLIRTETDGRVRLRMLETIREYGLVMLESRAERDRIRDCYFRWCNQLVDDLSRTWFSREQEAFAVLGTEHANLRAAMAASMTDPAHRAVGLHIAASLWFYWIARAPSEGRQWFERLLAAASADPESLERTGAAISYAHLLVMQGERARGYDLLHTALAAARRFGDELYAGYATHVLGLAASFDGDSATAARLMGEAVDSYRKHGASEGWAVTLTMQAGLVRTLAGETDLAHELFTSAAAVCERHGEQWLHSYVLYGLSLIDHQTGRSSEALERLVRCMRLKDPFDDVVGTALVLELVAWIRADQGDGERAGVALGAAGRLWRAFGMELYDSQTWFEHRRRCEELVTTQIGEVAFEKARSRGANLGRHDALARVLGPPDSGRDSPVRRDRQEGGHLGPTLTKREAQIAAFVAQGLTNRAIAARLTLSTRTIEGHVQQLLSKLGFSSRAQIAAWVSARSPETARSTGRAPGAPG